MLAKRDWVRRHADHLRRALLFEPRGHRDLCAAILTEPTASTSHAGVLFMDGNGVSTMSGHGVIAVTTIALERSLIVPGGDGASLVLDTPAGTVRARATVRRDDSGHYPRVAAVAFANVPSFVLQGGLTVAVGHRTVRADVAFGGAFYAIVDSEALGLPLDAAHLPELRRAGVAVARAIDAAHRVAHPLEPGLKGISGTIFTAAPNDERAGLRSVTIVGDGRADRSPSGTGTAAVMAVLDAMGLLGTDAPFVHESMIGTHLVGRVLERTTVGDTPAIIPEIEGAAWVTGDHAFSIDEDDPLAWGYRV